MPRCRLPLAFALLSLLAAAPAAAQDLGRQVEEQLAAIEAAPIDEIWVPVERLWTLGRPAIPEIERGVTRADPKVRLACAFLLYRHNRKDDALATYGELLREGDLPIAGAAALAFAGQVRNDASIHGRQLNDLTAGLRQRAADAGAGPEAVSLWLAHHRLQGDAESPRQILQIFRRSTNRAVRDAAALALAEMDQFSEAREHLRYMSTEPTPEGRMALAYLRVLQLQDDLMRGRRTQRYDFALLDETLTILHDYYFDPAAVVDDERVQNAATGMVAGLDRYSAFYDEDAVRQLRQEEMEGRYGGIGARVAMRKDRVGIAWLTIEEPIYSGPAYQAGLRTGDRITEIEGESTANLEVEVLVRKLRGPPDTEVHFKVYSRRWREVRDFTLTRREIELETTLSEVLPGNIGYVKLTTFGDRNTQEVRQAVRTLTDAGMVGLILDLRGNSGGYLTTSVRIADLFLPDEALIVESRGRENVEQTVRYTAQTPPMTEVPMVVLVDGGSASASEILAGALADQQRAKLVGERTFGKGSVQRLIPVSATQGRCAVRVTTAKWFLPSGRTVEGHGEEPGGIIPEIVVAPAERPLYLEAELDRFYRAGMFDRYLAESYEANRETFGHLADFDRGDPNAYPGFEAFYQGLETRAEPEEIRQLLREEVRRRVADERGREWVVDPQADRQLQRGILEICTMANIDPESIERYRAFAHAFPQNAEAPEQPQD